MDKLSNMGLKIAQLRKAHGMTQEELGKQMSVSAQAVSKWENGDSLPDLPLIAELADTFACTTDYLLGRAGELAALLPQIRESLAGMTTEKKISFLSDMINAADAGAELAPFASEGHPSLVHIHLGPSGIGLWAKDRVACIATTAFLNESINTWKEEAGFPLTLLPDDVRSVLLALLRGNGDLNPDYAIDEDTLQSLLPQIDRLHDALNECIELGFADRVKGGYRLNFKGDLAVRLLAIIHQAINKRGTLNVTTGLPQ